MGDGAGSNAFPSCDATSGDIRDVGDKILTAGPSTWECAQTNLVDELRNLVRARDIALAEQRARHVKESVVFREQRHALAISNPAFSSKIAKLFGWTDVVGSPTNDSPLFISPELSRSGSPINSPITSPTAARRNEDEDRQEGGATRADILPDTKREISDSLKTTKDLRDVTVLANGPHRSSTKDCQTQALPPCETIDSAMPLIVDSNNNQETAIAACPRCMNLRRELEMALADRTLAEAELVSMRRTILLVDPAWEFESAGGATNQHAIYERFSVEPGVGESEEYGAEKTAPLSPLGTTANDLDLRGELGRLENVVSVGEDSPSPDIFEKAEDGVGLPTLQESVLQPEGEGAARNPASLATSLSTTVASRARYFEELSRRRLLRLGIETDLRAARSKLDKLLATATASTLLLDHTKGDDGKERDGQGKKLSDDNDGDDMHGEAEQKGHSALTGKAANRKGVDPPAADSVLSKRGGVSGISEGGEAGRKQGVGSQQSKHRMGRTRGNFAVQENTPAPAGSSQHQRRFRAPEETKTAHTLSQPKSEESHTSGTAENTTKPNSNNRKKKTGLDPRHATTATESERPKKPEKARPQSITDTTVGPVGANDESKNASATTSDPLGAGKLQEKGEISGHPSDADGAQGPKRNGGSLAEDGCAAASPMEEKSRTKEGEEESPCKQGSDKASKSAAQTTDSVQESITPSTNFGRARSSRTSPRRTKGVPSSTVQLRQLPVSPRRGRTNDSSSETGQSDAANKNGGEQLETSSDVPDESRPTENTQGLEVGTTGQNECPPRSEGAIGEEAADTTEFVPKEVAEAAGCGEGEKERLSKQTGQAQTSTKSTRRQISGGSPPSKVVRATTAQKSTGRSLGKTSKVKPALRGRGRTPTRLGLTTKAKRASAGNCTDDATGPVPEIPPQNLDVAAGGAGDSQKPEETEVDNSFGDELGVESTLINTTDIGVQGGESEADGTARGDASNTDLENGTTTAGRSRQDSSLGMKHEVTAISTRGDKVSGNNGDHRGRVDENCEKTMEESGGGSIDASEQSSDGDSHLLPKGAVDLAKALGVEVDRLRLEKAELEDTVAQLNVAAAQLYFVEYEQMKAKCHQLKRVVLGPASRPTEQESTYGSSCQEIMFRLKLIGISFFRRRVGGVMGANFFPDGLARILSLIRSSQVAQGCQTAPVERLGPLRRSGGSPGIPRTRDVHVQVAGGIDSEDEPLMEQQVYALLGKVDLLLKRREDVLGAYHREAEEGAREARALLASAAAQHSPDQAWGMSRPPNVRQLIGGREGPAGAPRPAINPTNLLFTAAVVLDSVVEAGAAPIPEPFQTSKPTAGKTAPSGVVQMVSEDGGGGGSRRARFSPAEKALMELADEVVTALELEQQRSDASAERRRFFAERRNSSDGHRGEGGDKILGRPPVGVPPLIWAMEIHLVGKLARAFRTAVEARGFEREVEDANLVAAVCLGRSPQSATKCGSKSEVSPPWHLGHRILSVLRGEEDEEEKERWQRARGDFEKDENMVNSKQDQQQFSWGADTYSPGHGKHHRPKRDAGGTNGHHRNPSPTTSPRRAEGLARGEQPGRQATKIRTGLTTRHHGSSLIYPAAGNPGSAYQPKSTRQYGGSRVAPGSGRKVQNQQQQQRDPEKRDAAVVACAEAALFTVRPSRLHPRPVSASVEGRSGRFGCEDFGTSPATAEHLRPRPQSARLAEHADGSAGSRSAYHSMPPDNQGSRGRRVYEEVVPPESNMATYSHHHHHHQQQQQQPVRPTAISSTSTSNATARRPASAGGRVVDTRIWSSNKNATEPGAGVFRCRPNKSFRAASVRFKGAANSDGVSGVPSSTVPTHSGEVPDFLRRKERELIEFDREKRAAVNGRFEVVSDDDETNGGGIGERDSGRNRVEYRSGGGPRGKPNGDMPESRAPEGGERGGERGGIRMLSSVRIEDSMDGEGLLPDAGEQAFFDAWKPTGYDIDLSRYD